MGSGRSSSVIAAALLSLSVLPASAMEMSVEGSTAILTGRVVRSDCDSLESLLDKHRITRVVLTESGGGDAPAGYCIGALIRRRGLPTTIRGRCASSCSRMWLGGVERTLDGSSSRVGLHGNYASNGGLLPEAPGRLRAWIPQYAPDVDKALMEQWIHLPVNRSMMYFYNDRAELCENGTCTRIEGRNVHNVGLATK